MTHPSNFSFDTNGILRNLLPSLRPPSPGSGNDAAAALNSISNALKEAVHYTHFSTFANCLLFNQLSLPRAAFPMLDLCYDYVRNALHLQITLDPQVAIAMTEDPSAKIENLLIEYLNAVNAFKQKQDPQPILNFLNKWQERTEKTKEKNIKLQQIAAAIDIFICAFKSNQFDFFQKPAIYFLNPDLQIAENQKFRIAIESLRNILSLIPQLHELSGCKLFTTSKIDKKFDLINIRHFVLNLLKSNSKLSSVKKRCLYRIYLKTFEEFVNQTQFYFNCDMQNFGHDIFQHYRPVLKFQKGSKEPKEYAENDVIAADYIRQHRFIFENFLPYVEEIREVMLGSATKLIAGAGKLKNLPLYLIFGDFTQLIGRLETEKMSPLRFERILFEEIAKFSEQITKDRNFGAKVFKAALKRKQLGDWRAFFNSFESAFVEVRQFASALMDGPLDFAKSYQNSLLMFHPSQHPHSTLPIIPTKQASSVEKEKEKEVESLSTSPVQPMTNAASTQQKTCPIQLLDQARKLALDSLKSMASNCAGYGAQEAMENARCHFEDLFHTLTHFHQQSQSPLSSRQILCFVANCARHCTLITEQLLMCLAVESNKVRKRKDFDKYLSHNLYSLLIKCKCKAGPFPAYLRNWIQGTNRGEIIMRELSHCKFNVSALQSLLARTHKFNQGNSPYTAQGIARDTLTYLKNLGKFCRHFYLQIDAVKKTSNPSQKSISEDFQRFFAALCSSLELQFSELTMSSEPLAPITSIRKNLEELQAKSPDASLDFKNILSHFLPHLEEELTSQPSLSPRGAHSHIANVFILNQMILEGILWNFIDVQTIPAEVDFELHDLFKMVQAVGLSSTDFKEDELAFLQRGKETRQLVRYPASHAAAHASQRSTISSDIRELFSRAREMAAHANKDLDTFNQIKALARHDVEVLERIIATLIRKLDSFENKEIL